MNGFSKTLKKARKGKSPVNEDTILDGTEDDETKKDDARTLIICLQCSFQEGRIIDEHIT